MLLFDGFQGEWREDIIWGKDEYLGNLKAAYKEGATNSADFLSNSNVKFSGIEGFRLELERRTNFSLSREIYVKSSNIDYDKQHIFFSNIIGCQSSQEVFGFKLRTLQLKGGETVISGMKLQCHFKWSTNLVHHPKGKPLSFILI